MLITEQHLSLHLNNVWQLSSLPLSPETLSLSLKPAVLLFAILLG